MPILPQDETPAESVTADLCAQHEAELERTRNILRPALDSKHAKDWEKLKSHKTIRLLIEGVVVSENPSMEELANKLASLDGKLNTFAILELNEWTYIQTAFSVKNGFQLEFQDGSLSKHYYCTNDLNLENITKAFQSYAEGGKEWQEFYNWQLQDVTNTELSAPLKTTVPISDKPARRVNEPLAMTLETEMEKVIMRTTTFNCPACQQRIEAPAEIAGQTVTCPTCGQSFVAPTAESLGIRAFDLNIEEVLENWEVEHALREIIANALDEQVISNTAEIEITKDEQGDWHIRDYGRGLQIEHFTLNENKEKLDAPSGVIGKFGVGLKDALATFHRRGVSVLIRSSFGTYRLKQEHKFGFDNIITLHIEYDDTANEIVGTEFILHGVTDADMAKAKSLFLKFAGEQIYETNTYGQILRRKGAAARVYILGVFASEESNFLFSYNITSLTDSMRKKLNRERLNVGRATYADRVKAILKNAKNEAVETLLIEQVEKRATGEQSDEMAWIEISQMALNLMHQRKKVAYFTEEELQSRPNVLDSVRSDGYQVVVITDQQKTKLETQILTGGPQVRTLETYVQEYNASFEYKFVELAQLTKEERRIYDFTAKVLSLIGLANDRIPTIRISETMRVTTDDTEGVWDSSIKAVVIKRSKLSSLVGYAATLLHEAGHATTGTVDATREFERVLTNYLGMTAVAAINRRESN